MKSHVETDKKGYLKKNCSGFLKSKKYRITTEQKKKKSVNRTIMPSSEIDIDFTTG